MKSLVASRSGEAAGQAYTRWRVEAETCARQRKGKGKDVNIDEIFALFHELSGLSTEESNRLRQLEESMEKAAISQRPDGVRLLQTALAAGKRVALASDMYLERSFIEGLLADCSVEGWHAFYLSSDIGLRKDSGELYEYILAEERLNPQDVLVVGDNERSDFQIPNDMGMLTYHLLRPVELAKALPRLGSLVETTLNNEDQSARLALGLIVRENFHPLYYPQFDPNIFLSMKPEKLGYSVLGPMVLAFAQWVGQQTRADGVQRLYFLAREGQFLMQVYERWREAQGSGAEARYLILSRRAVSVPLVREIEDAVQIAKMKYFPNTIENFLHTRFGLKLSATEWEDIYHKGLWKKGRLLEINDERTDHLLPLLKAVLGRLVEIADSEKQGLLSYLESMGLMDNDDCAVVDVGYSATIQKGLNRILNRPVHGYYMATWEGAKAASDKHGVVANGCFGHLLNATVDMHPLLQESFQLEKLLSSDDPQITCHQLDDAGRIQPVYRSLSDDELKTKDLRATIRTGAMKFVNDALTAREKLYNEFIVPPEFSLKMFEAFVSSSNGMDCEVLDGLVLDDYYCGRDLVS